MNYVIIVAFIYQIKFWLWTIFAQKFLVISQAITTIWNIELNMNFLNRKIEKDFDFFLPCMNVLIIVVLICLARTGEFFFI